MGDPSVARSSFEGAESVVLAAGDYTATFLPNVGMLGASMTYQGEEYLSLQGGVDGYRHGHTTGLPLLYPWANRLERYGYSFQGADVGFEDTPPIHAMAGLPIHGTMTAAAGWLIESAIVDGETAALNARFPFGEHPAQLRSFPFPHEIGLSIGLSDAGLRVTTTVHANGGVDVPVSFGWHPYFVLPGVERGDLAVALPDLDHLALDDRMLPTGASTREPTTTVALGDSANEVTFDDAYRLIGDEPADRTFTIEGARHRLSIEFDAAYPYAQVYAPSDHPFVALEPMTAPINALVSGDHPVVTAGKSASSSFIVSVECVD